MPVVLKELMRAGLLHGDCMTASGRTIGEELDDIRGEADGRVIYPDRHSRSRRPAASSA